MDCRHLAFIIQSPVDAAIHPDSNLKLTSQETILTIQSLRCRMHVYLMNYVINLSIMWMSSAFFN